jgi:hypothetical protein
MMSQSDELGADQEHDSRIICGAKQNQNQIVENVSLKLDER